MLINLHLGERHKAHPQPSRKIVIKHFTFIWIKCEADVSFVRVCDVEAKEEVASSFSFFSLFRFPLFFVLSASFFFYFSSSLFLFSLTLDYNSVILRTTSTPARKRRSPPPLLLCQIPPLLLLLLLPLLLATRTPLCLNLFKRTVKVRLSSSVSLSQCIFQRSRH